jgi:CHAD domain-containing protein
VQRVLLEEQLDRFPELLLLRDRVGAEERRCAKELAPQTRAIRIGRLRKALRALMKRLEAQAADPRAEESLTAFVVSSCAEAWHEVLKRRSQVNLRDVSTIHRERVAFKTFRYMVEAVSPTLTGLNSRDLLTLTRYQRKLGTIKTSMCSSIAWLNTSLRTRAVPCC